MLYLVKIMYLFYEKGYQNAACTRTIVPVGFQLNLKEIVGFCPKPRYEII